MRAALDDLVQKQNRAATEKFGGWLSAGTVTPRSSPKPGFSPSPAWECFSAMLVAPLLPPGQAVFATVFKFTPKTWARDVVTAPSRLQFQLDELNRTPHPVPYRKPFLSPAPHGAVLLAIENVHFTQADADSNSLSWAWQIAHQAGLSELEWDVEVVASQQITALR